MKGGEGGEREGERERERKERDGEGGVSSESLSLPAANYTREAGVRNLERTIGSVCRTIAVKVNSTLTLRSVFSF